MIVLYEAAFSIALFFVAIQSTGSELVCDQLSSDLITYEGSSVFGLNLSDHGLYDHDVTMLCSCPFLNYIGPNITTSYNTNLIHGSPKRVSDLEMLILSQNQLDGHEIHPLFACLPNLRIALLDHNPITGFIPETFIHQRLLEVLDVGSTNLYELPSKVLHPISSSLQILKMDHIPLSVVPDDMFRTSTSSSWALRDLRLNDIPSLRSISPFAFANLHHLSHLDVSNTSVGCIPLSRHSIGNITLRPWPISICQSALDRPASLTAALPVVSLSDSQSAGSNAPNAPLLTRRLLFSLILNYTTMTDSTRSMLINGIQYDINHITGIPAERIVNVQLGQGSAHTTLVQTDILVNEPGQDAAADQAVDTLRIQSRNASSPFRTSGTVTKYFNQAKDILYSYGSVTSCGGQLYVDSDSPCPSTPSNSEMGTFGEWYTVLFIVSAIILTVLVTTFVFHQCRGSKDRNLRMHEAMTDVRDLSRQPHGASSSAPQIFFSTSILPYASSNTSSSIYQSSMPLRESTAYKIKRPGLNAIKRKKMMLNGGEKGDESMPDTDYEF